MKRLPIIRHIRYVICERRYRRWEREFDHESDYMRSQIMMDAWWELLEAIWEGKA